ncbi:glycosyltransferase [Georgenia alba]|uniref:Glycosyltransferase n=1 Tax=Georgenia alba TaxID=2233858 RepID=A0ABW2Q5W3_9MICO
MIMTLTAVGHAVPRTGDPRPSVIIPAHDEEAVVGDGLHALLADSDPDEFEVVVVCNGCTDRTAERARQAADRLGRAITVLSIREASKVAAIRAAEEWVTGFPRIYLDADVRCPTATLRAMVRAIRAGAGVAVPTRTLDTTGSAWAARAYYEGWQALPWVQEQLAGRGAYAVGAATRTRFGVFPEGIADDRYVTTRVPRQSAVVVPEPVVVRPPARAADVLRVRRRVYAGNQQVEAPAHDAPRAARLLGLARTVLTRPSLVPAMTVFAGITTVAKASAGLAVRRGRVGWGRDTGRGGRLERSLHEPRAGRGAAPESERSGVVQAPAIADLDVVVLTYRSASYVRECLEAVDTALASVPGARIIVVDNASGDAIARTVRGVSGRLELVLRETNDGFARGCHAGAERSSARRLLFLNPDAVVEPDAVEALLRCAREHPRAGLVGGRSLTPDGRTDPRSLLGRPSLWSAVCFATGLSSLFPGSRLFDPQHADHATEHCREVSAVSGGMMLVDRAAWDELAGFDRSYFLYGEDVDLCLRARSAGWAPRLCPDARYRHQVGASSAGSHRLPLVLRGEATTYRRHVRRPWGDVAVHLLVLGTGLRALTAHLRPHRGRPASGVSAWRESWARRAEWRRGWGGEEQT